MAQTHRTGSRALLAIAASLCLLGAYAPPVRTRGGLVAADTELASRAGAEILAAGGNAVDAAVATALALGVVSPASSGLGGGGFALVWKAEDRSVRVVDFRETAPAAASATMFVRDGQVQTSSSRRGGLAVAVPGEPAGLAWLSERYGSIGLRRSAAPAIRLARRGFAVTPFLAELAVGEGRATIEKLLPVRGLPLERDRLVRADLAATLERLASQGRDGFYRGPIARAIVESARAAGGVLTEADLGAYRVVEREPVRLEYRGHTVLAAPPPAGGVTMLEILGVLGTFELGRLGPGSSATLHHVAEACRIAFADRTRVHGDPAFADIPVASLIDAAELRRRAEAIHPDRAAPLERFGGGAAASGGGTSHVSVIDAAGNAVALSTTVNLDFGAQIVARGTGVILNDEMDDFTAAPGVANAFGLVQGSANAIVAGKRPASSMTPTIVIGPDGVRLVLGASGGPRIVTAVAQAIVHVLDFGMDVSAAVGSPRVHHQLLPDQLDAEAEVPADVRQGLGTRGHRVVVARRSAAVQMIERRGPVLTGASDPRRGGVPAAADPPGTRR